MNSDSGPNTGSLAGAKYNLLCTTVKENLGIGLLREVMARRDFNSATNIDSAGQRLSTVTKVTETISKVGQGVTLACSIALTNEFQVFPCYTLAIVNNLNQQIYQDYLIIITVLYSLHSMELISLTKPYPYHKTGLVTRLCSNGMQANVRNMCMLNLAWREF